MNDTPTRWLLVRLLAGLFFAGRYGLLGQRPRLLARPLPYTADVGSFFEWALNPLALLACVLLALVMFPLTADKDNGRR